MDNTDSAPPEPGDYTAAMPLEIGEETAARTDDLLREFAEDAGLDTALVVDRSGALVAGISAEAEVTVEVISALVAGASGAMRALVAQLGETGTLESLHLGGNRLIYLKETVHRFVLVAVATASRPAGLVRQKALAIEGRLVELLRDVRPPEPPEPPPAPTVKSLREVARERAARRVVTPPPIPGAGETVSPTESEAGGVPGSAPEPEPEIASEVEEPPPPCDRDPEPAETFETLDLAPELEFEPMTETEPAPPSEPREVLEPIDFGEPEVVIERSSDPATPPPVDSPFEPDDWEEDEEDFEIVTSPPAVGESVFEIEDADEEDEAANEEHREKPVPVPVIVPPELPISLFEEDDGTEERDDDGPDLLSGPKSFFEFDAEDEEDEDEEEASAPSAASGTDPEGGETIDEEDEESEIRSSGPYYF